MDRATASVTDSAKIVYTRLYPPSVPEGVTRPAPQSFLGHLIAREFGRHPFSLRATSSGALCWGRMLLRHSRAVPRTSRLGSHRDTERCLHLLQLRSIHRRQGYRDGRAFCPWVPRFLSCEHRTHLTPIDGTISPCGLRTSALSPGPSGGSENRPPSRSARSRSALASPKRP